MRNRIKYHEMPGFFIYIILLVTLPALSCTDNSTVIERLNNSEPEIREAALLELAKSNNHPDNTLKLIEETIEDKIPYVRGTALWALYKYRYIFTLHSFRVWDPFVTRGGYINTELRKEENENIRNLKINLDANVANERLTAIVLAAEAGENARIALAAIIDALSDKDPRVRFWAALALGSVKPESNIAVPLLIEALKDDDSSTRCAATISIAKFGSEATVAIQSLIEVLLNESNPVVMTGAVFALGRIGQAAGAAVPHLNQKYDGAPYELSREIIYSLGTIGGKDAVGFLTSLLSDDDPRIRGDAAMAIGWTGEAAEGAIEPLISLIQNDTSEIRMSAIVSIGEIGKAAKAAVPVLLNVLKESETTDVKMQTIIAIGKIGSNAETAIPAMLELLEYEDDEYLSFIAGKALGLIGSSAVPDLIEVLKTGSDQARASAIYGLGLAGPVAAEAIPELIEFLRNDNWLLRSRAVEALGNIGPSARDALPALRELVDTDEYGAVKEAIAKIEEEEDSTE